MHILIIDDHDFVCAGLKATLMERFVDAQISIANDGSNALDILSRGSINLVISDLFMPGSSGGFSFIDLICKNHSKVPLIVLSASENPSHIRKCVAIGAMGFVTKSAPLIPVAELRDTLDQLLEGLERKLKKQEKANLQQLLHDIRGLSGLYGMTQFREMVLSFKMAYGGLSAEENLVKIESIRHHVAEFFAADSDIQV